MMAHKRWIILGGGISGLSLAWFLKRRFGERIDLKLLEKAERPGGWIQTIQHEGFLFEKGPRGCRSKHDAIETLKLIEQLNLQNQVIAASPSARYRYLLMDKKLRRLPAGPFSLMASSLMCAVISAFIRDLRTLPAEQEDESIYCFISRRFNRAIAEKLIDPFVSGIFAGDIRKLSIKSCFPLLHQWEQSHGSVLKGALASGRKKTSTLSPFIQEMQKHPLFSLKKGMASLVDELAKKLQPHLLLSHEVKALRWRQQCVEIELSNGLTLEADHLFSTIPAYALAPLVAPLHQALSSLLADIPTVSLALVSLGYHRSVLPKKGFGYLVPTREKEKILGVVWDSSVFPQQNQIPEETRLTVMMGGEHMPHMIRFSEQELKAMALNAISSHLGIETVPDAISVTVAKSAIPQYVIGHARKVTALETTLSRVVPNMTLSGHSFYGISVNDCIANNKRLEEKV